MTMTGNANLTGAVMMMASMAFFTLNDAIVKLVAQDVPLFQLVFLRGVATTLMLAAMVYMAGRLHFAIPREDRGKVTWRTLLEVATMVAFLIALTNMPLANATAILAALPLFVTLGAWMFLGHPIGWRRLVAILIGFCGVMLIVQPGTDGFNAYALLALFAVILITARDLVTRCFSDKVPSMTVAVITAAGVTAFGGAASVFETWVALDLRSAALILGASIFIIGAYICSIRAMRVGDISFVSPFRYTSLVWALILGVVIFAEFPNTLALTGAAIVVATGLFTLWRERQVQHG